MNHRFLSVAVYLTTFISCYDANTGIKPAAKKDRYTYRETIVTGSDTGMITLGAFRRNNIADVLCQRWELLGLKKGSDDEMISDSVDNFIGHGMALFKDSSVLLNPFGKTSIAKWQVENGRRYKTLILQFSDKTSKRYILRKLSSTQLLLDMPNESDHLRTFVSSAKVHHKMYNDPFHPVNNQWRLKPAEPESSPEIHTRIKNCLLFFALYYRDHIKRQAETISFKGLPEIFTWYNRGIGLPDKDNLSDSWIDCFYDREQALQGYSILRKLIVDYEYKWPRRAPGWTYETHSVLEQMYHKIDALKTDSVASK